MKRLQLLIILFCFGLSGAIAQTTVTVSSSGFTFSPATATINVGDTIKFVVGGSHTASQVSEVTWNANGSTVLSGGFDFGAGTNKFKFTEPGTYYYVCKPHAGMAMKGKIIVNGTTGVNEKLSSLANFSVYPSPVSSVGTVEFALAQSSDVQLKIYNLLGGVVRHESPVHFNAGSHALHFSVENLQHGVYLLELMTGSQRVVKKIAVK